MKQKLGKVNLPLYYLLLASIAAGAFYFLHGWQPIEKTTVLSAKKDDFLSNNLWVTSDTVYFKYNCSYRDDLVQIPVFPKTLHIYNESYFGDSNSIWNSFFSGCNPPTKVELDPPVDVATFAIISDNTRLAKDKYGLIGITEKPQNGAYGDHVQISVRIPGQNDNLQYISNNVFVKNGKAYYFEVASSPLAPIPDLPADIQKIYRDGNSSVLYVITTKKVFLLYPYSSGSIKITKELVGADPLTFHKLEVGNYWADKNTVYFDQVPLVDASTTDFASVSVTEGYVASNKHIYFGNKKVTDTPYSSTFHIIAGQPTYDEGSCESSYYWTNDWQNGKGVYYNGKALGADPDKLIFQYFFGFKCIATGYVWDWKSYFYKGQKIVNVDPQSFRIIKNQYVRDNFHVYEEGRVMLGDPDQLEAGILSGNIPHVNTHEYGDDTEGY